MPPDRPRHPPGPAPDDPYYWGDDERAQERTDRGGPRRRPDPGQQEVHHLRDGEWAQARNQSGTFSRRTAPTRSERFYLEGGEGPRDRGPAGGEGARSRNGSRNPRGQSAPTRMDRFPVDGGRAEGGRGPGGRGGAGSPRSRQAPTRMDRFTLDRGEEARRRSGGGNWDAQESDDRLRARQMAGINALISIANIDSGMYDRQLEGMRALFSVANEVAIATRSRETISSPTGEIRKQSRLSVISKLRQDEMIWNSLFLVVNTGLQSGTGFLFWIIAARLFSAGDVGIGSALISGVTLIGGLALLGLNMGISRYLPSARNRDALISSGIAMVATVGALGGVIYILLTPLVAPQLAFVGKSPMLIISFALIAAAFAVNTLTDNIFIALRNAKYTVFVDGVIGGFGKLGLTFIVAGAGAYGLFLASSLATALAAVASLLILLMVMKVRIDLSRPLDVLRPLLRFAGANYVADVITRAAGLVIPIMLLDRLGAASSAYYFVVFQMAQIVYTAGLALEQTFLTEGSRSNADMRQLRRRSLRLLVLFFVTSAVIMIGLGHWLLLAFGKPYYQFGYTSLIILVLAAGPISANSWLQTILRLEGKLRAIVVINVIAAIATLLGIWFGTSYGLTGVAWGWFGGVLLEACIAGVAARERHR